MSWKWTTTLLSSVIPLMLLGCVGAGEPVQMNIETRPSETTGQLAPLSAAQPTPATAGVPDNQLLQKPATPALPDQLAPQAEPGGTPMEHDPNLDKLLEQAKEDLAKRLSVSADTLTVLQAQAVVWPDAGMGCPQPGMAYLQVPQDGVFIELAFQGKVYAYHGGGNRDLFLCQQMFQIQKEKPPQIDLLAPLPGQSDD